jgi:hypothetical protein
MLHLVLARAILNLLLLYADIQLPKVTRMTIETRQSPGPAQTWHTHLDRLEGLAEVLAKHGLQTRLMTPPGRVPSLHVVNPAASALAEDVYLGRCRDGGWWFWWSWAERIASGEDLEGAAGLIERVLAARPAAG